jgi:dTDP-4-amino-4,6-dideoxygalactose transaminase
MQCRIGGRHVAHIQTNIAHRLRITARYFEELPKLGHAVPKLPANAEIPLLRFPLRVANKQEALAAAPSHGVEIGSWFECPLHPIETDQATFGYHDGECPVAEQAAREVVNLPTHQRVSEKDLQKTLRFVSAVCRPA